MDLRASLQNDTLARLWRPESQFGYYAHYDASRTDLMTRDGSNLVSDWRSAIGGLSLAQGTGSLQPTWTANLQNGLPGVVFAADAMSGTVAINADEITVMGVCSITNASSSNGVGIGFATSGGTSNDADGWDCVKRNAATEAIHTRQNGTSGANVSVTYATTFAMMSIKSSGTIRIGVDASANTLSRTWTLQAQRMSLGAALTAGGLGTAYWNGAWHELIVFAGRGLPTTRERQLVTAYLAWKWATPKTNLLHMSAPPNASC